METQAEVKTESVANRVSRALAQDDLRCAELGMEPASDEWFDSNSHAALKAAHHAELVEALRPFAKAAEVKLCASEGYWSDDKTIQGTDVAFYITFGDLKRALSILAKLGGDS